jgi:hypothetical protein
MQTIVEQYADMAVASLARDAGLPPGADMVTSAAAMCWQYIDTHVPADLRPGVRNVILRRVAQEIDAAMERAFAAKMERQGG